MLDSNWSLVEAKFSNSYCGGNNRHGCVVNIPHLLDLYGNRLPGAGKASAHQGADEVCVILSPEATYVSQNGLFALHMSTRRTFFQKSSLTFAVLR